MMQVVGGMDRLPAALAARLGNRIVYRAAVREIRQSERGVWVIYADADGRPQRVDADYCVCTIPLPVLSGLEKDLSQPVQSAIAAAGYDGAGKIGLQFKRRFWEQDDEIYGGRSWTDQEIGQIIYPSHGFNGSKGRARRLLPGFRARPCATALPPNVSGWRSSRAPVSTRSTRPSSRRRSPSRGLACHGAAAHGGRNRPRRMKRSSRSANPTAGCTSLAIT